MEFNQAYRSDIGEMAYMKSDNMQDYAVNHFIGYYCDPKVIFKIGSGSFPTLLMAYPHDDEVGRMCIQNHLKRMHYQEFLETPYWKSIAYRTKERFGFKCAMCPSTKLLNAHHRDYKFRGIEIVNMKELTCVCEKCHLKYHNL